MLPDSALPARNLRPGVSVARTLLIPTAPVTPASPASAVMIDRTQARAVTVNPTTALQRAEQFLIHQRVHMLFVVSEMPELQGLVTTTDLRGDRAMRTVQERNVHYEDLCVADAMTPLSMLDAIDDHRFARAGRATTGHRDRGVGPDVRPCRARTGHVLIIPPRPFRALSPPRPTHAPRHRAARRVASRRTVALRSWAPRAWSAASRTASSRRPQVPRGSPSSAPRADPALHAAGRASTSVIIRLRIASSGSMPTATPVLSDIFPERLVAGVIAVTADLQSREVDEGGHHRDDQRVGADREQIR